MEKGNLIEIRYEAKFGGKEQRNTERGEGTRRREGGSEGEED